MPINNFGDFLQLLKGIKPAAGGRYEALCPAHTDERRSLSVWLDGDKILVKCHAGCSAEEIVKSMGLEMKDLFLSHPEKPKPVRAPNAETKKLGEISNIYQYTDEAGKLLFEVVKYKPKDFRQRQPDGKGGYVWNIQGIKPTLYHLPEILEAVKNKKTIYVPEGEKDSDNIRAWGLPATTSPMGAGPGKWKDAHSAILKGADVVVIADVDPVPEKKKPEDPDKEPAGISFAKEKCILLKGAGCKVRLFVPPVGLHEDISDWIERGGTKEKFLELVNALPAWEPAPGENESILPVIETTFTRLRDMTSSSLKAVGERNNPPFIFIRSGEIVRISRDEHNKPIIERMGEGAIRGLLERTINFTRPLSKGGSMPIPPPLEVVRDIMSLGEWNFPPLQGITETPIIRPDGSILSNPGYDKKTELYYAPDTNLTLTPVPENPSTGDIESATSLLNEIICEFPFKDESSKTNTIASMMTPVLRSLITGPVPITLFDKPQAGTGASLLADVTSIIATGRASAMLTMPSNEEEWRKSITSILSLGQTIVTIDNIEGRLYAPSLASVITATTWQDRILGHTQMISLPHRVTWIATGNNIRLAGDLPRRCFWIRMDAKEARPWERTNFKHPKLSEWVTVNRGNIITAILTIARAWIISGKKRDQKNPSIGSFESWCDIIGNILSFSGFKGFLLNLEEMYDTADEETPAWEAFINSWHENVGAKFLTVADLIGEMKTNPSLAESIPPDLGDSIEDKGFTRKLGRSLTKRSGVRYSNGLVIEKGKVKHQAITWRINTVENSQNSQQGELGELIKDGGVQGVKENMTDLVGDNSRNSPFKGETPPISSLVSGSSREFFTLSTHGKILDTYNTHDTHIHAYGAGEVKNSPDSQNSPFSENTPFIKESTLSKEQIIKRGEEMSFKLEMDVVHAYELWESAGSPELKIGDRVIEDLGEVLIFEELTEIETEKIKKWLKMQET